MDPYPSQSLALSNLSPEKPKKNLFRAIRHVLCRYLKSFVKERVANTLNSTAYQDSRPVEQKTTIRSTVGLPRFLNSTDGYLHAPAEKFSFDGLPHSKVGIAVHVAKHTKIPVPRIFQNLEEACKTLPNGCGTTILRSEHPKDFYGTHGALPSWRVQCVGNGTFHRHTKDVLYEAVSGNVLIEEFTQLLKAAAIQNSLDQSEVGYSVWEYIPGTNYAIQAVDTTGEYDIFEQSTDGVYKEFRVRPDALEASQLHWLKLIGSYETVRGILPIVKELPPIMEFQRLDNDDLCETDNYGKYYFLQYILGNSQN